MAQARIAGFDRLNDVWKSVDEQLQDLRERFDHSRKRLEKEVRERGERISRRVQDTGLYKRAESARERFESELGERRSQVFGAFGIASKADVEKLNRKLARLSKQLSEISESRNPSSETPSEVV